MVGAPESPIMNEVLLVADPAGVVTLIGPVAAPTGTVRYNLRCRRRSHIGCYTVEGNRVLTRCRTKRCAVDCDRGTDGANNMCPLILTVFAMEHKVRPML